MYFEFWVAFDRVDDGHFKDHHIDFDEFSRAEHMIE